MSPRLDRSYCFAGLLKGLGGFREAYAGAEGPASASSGVSGETLAASLVLLPISGWWGGGIASGGTLAAAAFLSAALLCGGTGIVHGSLLSLAASWCSSALAGDIVEVLSSSI